MRYHIYVDYDGTTIGYCTDEHLQMWKDGFGAERPATPTDLDIYCVGCGTLLARVTPSATERKFGT